MSESEILAMHSRLSKQWREAAAAVGAAVGDPVAFERAFRAFVQTLHSVIHETEAALAANP